MNRGAAVAAVSLAVLLVVTTATPALAAVAPTNEATPPQVNESEVDSPGPFEIDELRSGGTQPSAAPPSVRYVGGQTPGGAVAIRYVPADPLSNDPVYLEGGQTLNVDEIRLYSTVFGEDVTGEYEAVIVYWKEETRRTENGTAYQVAANQEVQRATVGVESGYASAPIALNSHYKGSYQATMWLERDGEVVDGARWKFDHASAAASQQVQIDNQADAWFYAFRVAILPGVASIVVGLSGAKATQKAAGKGPGYSLTSWGLFSAFGLLAAVGGLYYEISAVVANFELLIGLALLPIAYGGGLRMSPPTEIIAFERKVLTDALSLRRGETESEASEAVTDGGNAAATGDGIGISREGYHDELYEEETMKTTVRTPEGDRLVPKQGIRPFFARLFASAAKLDLTDLKTKVKLEGTASEKVYVDPSEEKAVNHSPAHLRKRMPVWHRLPERDDGEPVSPLTRGLYGILTLATLALPYIGWEIGAATMNTPTVGAGVGVLLLAVESYEAVDGSISFTPAPRHDISADASLTVLQREHADGRTLEDTQEELWQERVRTTEEVQEHERRRDDTMAKRNAEATIGFEADDDREEDDNWQDPELEEGDE